MEHESMRGVNEIIIDKSFAMAAIKWRRTLDYNTVKPALKWTYLNSNLTNQRPKTNAKYSHLIG